MRRYAVAHAVAHAATYAAPRVETLGYDWEEVVRRGAPVLESGLKSTRRRSRLYDGGMGQARSACFGKRVETRGLRLKSLAYD